jgi:methylisocitrate lyase
MDSAGQKFRKALEEEKPLQLVGTINAYTALLAKQAGFRALYLSGAGVANAAFGLPDLGLTSLTEVAEEVRRITSIVELPLLVDGDTGWGGELNIQRSVQAFIQAGAAAVHFEDQSWPKRCGHRTGKKLISKNEMVDKLAAAVEAKTDANFIIMARTDALAVEGIEAAIDRATAYIKAGAEMIFAEAVTEISQYHQFVQRLPVPILANITEFGKTPLFSLSELRSVGVHCILYPLSAFRAMSKVALNVYQTIRTEGSQRSVIDTMQTREELYQILNYYEYESKLE